MNVDCISERLFCYPNFQKWARGTSLQTQSFTSSSKPHDHQLCSLRCYVADSQKSQFHPPIIWIKEYGLFVIGKSRQKSRALSQKCGSHSRKPSEIMRRPKKRYIMMSTGDGKILVLKGNYRAECPDLQPDARESNIHFILFTIIICIIIQEKKEKNISSRSTIMIHLTDDHCGWGQETDTKSMLIMLQKVLFRITREEPRKDYQPPPPDDENDSCPLKKDPENRYIVIKVHHHQEVTPDLWILWLWW